ncbi:helicase-related protein [Phycicoccus sp. DTK01]|uniref:helicase-related protein n=1 Tax=Phycicoccus sp. DTK01 TaxID=2785745 RepID=UPI001A8C7B7C|nr:helicase-related protein [Phycicoccus sp. DTK01]GIL33996.1 helicase [Phycicoccus sp. DTK01]
MSVDAGAVPPVEVAPGSVVRVRDEEWLVTAVKPTTDGQLLTVHGLSELVRDTTATFYESLDRITVVDPARMTVVADDSPGYRRSRLWLEATLRKTALPVDDPDLSVSSQALADPLGYQQDAVRRALDPANLRPRVLLADAVGLGKTLEIGMILAELVRRGRGERILVVSPRHVLEQMQHELWTRFALPFVRLDSVGIQRVRQKLPATRNPFTMYQRAIISIDTLKNDRYLAHLRHHRWDAVVIDESHGVTNSHTQNNRLARVLAPNTDALILASATPHNGRNESFAELVRLLEPTAVRADGELVESEVRRLVVRRHRYSPEVASVVGSDWAERAEPVHRLVPASPSEDAVATELADVWLHPRERGPYSGRTALFPWTLAKAFLSSPPALAETIAQRMGRLSTADPAQLREREALDRLAGLVAQASRSTSGGSGKYAALLERLSEIGVRKGSAMRAVVFAERVATLHWLADGLRRDLGVADDAVVVLHGGLSDQDQQAIVESFKQESSPIRVLVTGDVASEGVNLHLQCHHLVHFDIPWSLIRIEQRNGRIDRYGQKHAPQITTLLLEPSHDTFSGDLRVLTRLLEKEQEAHTALGDAASLMGKYDVDAEEKEIRKVLAGEASLDDVVATPEQVTADGGVLGLLARLRSVRESDDPDVVSAASAPERSSLYAADVDYLEEALTHIYTTPEAAPGADGRSGGVSWRRHAAEHVVEFVPPPDLKRRLEVLPQEYLTQRRVMQGLKLATSKARGKALLAAALADDTGSSWPEAHFLGPLHPVLDWVSDRALAAMSRNEIAAVRGTVDHPTVLLQGSLTNRSGLTVSSLWISVVFFTAGRPESSVVELHDSPQRMLDGVGVGTTMANPGPVADVASLTALVPHAVREARARMDGQFSLAADAVQAQVAEWAGRIDDWTQEADVLVQRSEVAQRRVGVQEEKALAEGRSPDRRLVRPLLVVVPAEHPVDDADIHPDERSRDADQ